MNSTTQENNKNATTGVRKMTPRLSLRYIIIILLIAVGVSSVVVSGVFASFSASVVGIGTTPLAQWGFIVKIDDRLPDEEGYVRNINICSEINRDANTVTPIDWAAPGTSGYLPITIDATDVGVAMIVNVTAEFNYTNSYFSFTDNLGRPLTVTENTIHYDYYIPITEIRKWTEDNAIGEWDIGFRWKWDENDPTDYENLGDSTDGLGKSVFATVTVKGKQIASTLETQNKSAVHFSDGSDLISAINTINILYKDVTGNVNMTDITKNFYLDFNEHVLNGDLTVTSSDAVSIRLGTCRREIQSPGTITGKLTVTAPESTLFYMTDLTDDIDLSYNS